MKKIILIAALVISAFAADYSGMSVTQMQSMKGSVPEVDRASFQEQMQSKVKAQGTQDGKKKLSNKYQNKSGVMSQTRTKNQSGKMSQVRTQNKSGKMSQARTQSESDVMNKNRKGKMSGKSGAGKMGGGKR